MRWSGVGWGFRIRPRPPYVTRDGGRRGRIRNPKEVVAKGPADGRRWCRGEQQRRGTEKEHSKDNKTNGPEKGRGETGRREREVRAKRGREARDEKAGDEVEDVHSVNNGRREGRR